MNKGPCGVRQSLELKDFALVLFGVLVPDMGVSCYEKVYLGHAHQLVTTQVHASCIW